MKRQIKNTTKIAVVGHPQSGIDGIEQLLVSAGMAVARPSRRDGMTPQEINAALIKAHGARPVESLQSADQLQQIQVAPVWQGVVLDLMLGNLDSPVWGWMDPQAIYLLDYWKDLDPEMVFVLAYDAPHTALTRLGLDEAAASEQELQRRLDAWVAYNSALLHFHLCNPERSMLVHTQQIKSLDKRRLRHLSERIALPLDFTSQNLSATTATNELDAMSILLGDAQIELLIWGLMQVNPKARALYEGLQTASGMKSQKKIIPSPGVVGADVHYRAWQACVTQQQHIQHLSLRVQDVAAQNALLQEQVEQVQKQLDSAHFNEQEEKNKKLELQKDNDLLRTLLDKTQVELESVRLRDKESAVAVDSVKYELSVKTKQLKDIQAELTRQRHLVEEVRHNEQAEKNKALELQDENGLLLSNLCEIQKEFGWFHLQNKKLNSELFQQRETIHALQAQLENETQAKIELRQKLLGLEEERMHEAGMHYGAADRIRQELPYRLGECLIMHPRGVAGWISMPIVLWAEIKRFRKSEMLFRSDKFPPIEQYADAHEAEIMKGQLSYRLGTRLLTASKSLLGWLTMPWALRAEVKSFQLEHHETMNSCHD